MKFLAILEITPQTAIITLDKTTVIDTQGLTLSPKTWFDFFNELPKPNSDELIEMWKEERQSHD